MRSDAYQAFLLDHVAGNLSQEMALAAELHVLLSPEARQAVKTWSCAREALRGDRGNLADTSPEYLPEALELALADFDTVPWKRGLSGVHYAKRGKNAGRLMRLDPGQVAPEHSHSVMEATVVLEGEFEDGHGVYKRGDLVLGRPGIKHRPAAHGNQTCICFVGQEPLPFWRMT